MTVRKAKLTDIGAIYAIVVAAWAESPFGHIPLNELKTRHMIRDHIKHENSCCYVSLDDGGIDGVVGGSLATMLSTDAIASHNTLLYGKQGKKLLQKYTRWAEKKGAVAIGFDQSFGKRTEAITKFAKTQGYQHIGGLHVYIPENQELTGVA